MLFSWTPNFIPSMIFIFGCGGTGSRVVPLVAQFVKSCAWVVDPEMYLIDFDTVEEKNLLRQNFIASDVGQNKASVLANRYSRAFNINISALQHRVKSTHIHTSISDEEKETYGIFYEAVRHNTWRNNLFILCVDSPSARKEILSEIEYLVKEYPENIIIDGGNENDFGQVVVSGISGVGNSPGIKSCVGKLKKDSPVMGSISYIPLNHNYFNKMEASTAPSCAELDQTMAINALVAVNIFSLVQNIYYVKPISFHRINVSLQHGSTLEYIQPEYFVQNTMDSKYTGRDGPIYRELYKILEEQERWEDSLKPKVEPLEEVTPAVA